MCVKVADQNSSNWITRENGSLIEESRQARAHHSSKGFRMFAHL